MEHLDPSFSRPSPLHRPNNPSTQGAALLLVLALCGVLSLTLTAFLLLCTQSQSLAQSSTQRLQNELATRYAQTLLLSDLQQEIRAGSFPVQPSVHTTDPPALAPAPLLYAATPQSHPPAQACKHPDPPPNLLKQSAYRVPSFPANAEFATQPRYPLAHRYPPSLRACPCSTLTPSLNGRHLTPQRWNAPALLPRAFPKSSSNPTPASSGESPLPSLLPPWEWRAPDWILLQADGHCPPNLPPTSPQEPIRHRFAYQLYDIGGLLDLNVAGYAPSLTPQGFAARRGHSGWCELSELGWSSGVLDFLLEWRHPSGLANPTEWALSYHNFLQHGGRDSGFLRVAGIFPPRHANRRSRDILQNRRRFHPEALPQAFASRQSLLQWVRSIRGSPSQKAALWNSLQYLTHFSRSLEQPSFLPGTWHPHSSSPTQNVRIRPRIVPPAGEGEIRFNPQLSPPDRLLSANYRGGNDAAGADNLLNPGLALIRVETAFQRTLSGQFARIGEPLIKHRFPLTRLGWIQPEGPSASLPTRNPRHHPEGTPEAIYAAFGLRWNARREAWTYDHGCRTLPNGQNPGVRIATLQEVSTFAREADFFELLKAGIQAGSLGKAAALDRAHSADDPATPLDAASYHQLRDRSVDLQILQIGANLIDQADADSLPTQIELFNRVSPSDSQTLDPQILRGVEDLPYFFRLHLRAVADAQMPPSPWPPKSHPHEITEDLPSATPFHNGSLSLLALPELWNPHAQPTPSATASRSPDSPNPPQSATNPVAFRCVAISEDPDRVYPLGSPNWTAQNRFQLRPASAFAALEGPEESARVFFHSEWPKDGAPPSLSNRVARQSGFWRDLYRVEWPLPASQRANYQVLCFPLLQPPSETEAANPHWRPSQNFQLNRFSPKAGKPAPMPTVFALRESGFESLRTTQKAEPVEVQIRGTELLFELSDPRLFREPTTLCKPGQPNGSRLRAGPGHWLWSRLNPAPTKGSLPEIAPHWDSPREPKGSSPNSKPDHSPTDASTSFPTESATERWLGFCLGECPSSWIVASQVVDASGTPVSTDPYGWDPENGPREHSPFVQGTTRTPSLKTPTLEENGPGYSWYTPALLRNATVKRWRFFQVFANGVTLAPTLFTLRLQYRSPFSGQWITYDERYLQLEGNLFTRADLRHSPNDPDSSGIAWYPVDNRQRAEPLPWQHLSETSAWRTRGTPELGYGRPCVQAYDPRSARFGHPVTSAFSGISFFGPLPFWSGSLPSDRWVDPQPNPEGTPLRPSQSRSGPLAGAGWTLRPSALPPRQTANHLVPCGAPGAPLDPRHCGWFPNLIWDSPNRRVVKPTDAAAELAPPPPARFAQSPWLSAGQSGNPNVFRPGWLSDNRADPLHQYYADPDDIVRRSSAAFTTPVSRTGPPSTPKRPSQKDLPAPPPPGSEWGLPDSQTASDPLRLNRPILLNRPFRSVAEMAYAFRGTPWKHIDFFTPESADTALLDLFSTSELEHPAALCAGKVNLNTRQLPVLRALLLGALKDERTGDVLDDSRVAPEVQAAAEALLRHTSGDQVWQGPLSNLSELCGKILGRNLFPEPPPPGLSQSEPVYSYTIPQGRPDSGAWSYGGLALAWNPVFSDPEDQKIQRRRESVLRALVDSGQTRVWNLFLDLIVQTGRYPPGTQSLGDFAVEAESRVWVCWAIDRLTGTVLEEQVEPVIE
jgi:hypothetical protein